MTSKWPDNCDGSIWKTIANLLDIDFIHGDNHGRAFKNARFFPYLLFWYITKSKFKKKTEHHSMAHAVQIRRFEAVCFLGSHILET